jgi:hypothetical protein
VIRVFLASCLVLPIVGCSTPTGEPSISFTQSPSEKSSTMTDLRTCLVGRWLHSHEEDSGTTEIYRPEDYDFPPARGRTGYEFLPDGQAVYIGIASTDGSTETHGHWDVEAPDRVIVTMEDAGTQRTVLQVQDCGPDKLVVSR